MKLTITNDLKNIGFSVTCYSFEYINCKKTFKEKFLEVYNGIQSKYKTEEVTKINKLKITRDGYKLLKKDPSHTRPACEALIRRVLKNDQIDNISTLVDFGNLLSIMTMKSVCVVDLDKIKGNITIRLGTKDDIYYGINRGLINVSNLPLYCDELSPFGNPTSDTERTMIQNETRNVLVMLIHFSKQDMIEDENLMLELLNEYIEFNSLIKIY